MLSVGLFLFGWLGIYIRPRKNANFLCDFTLDKKRKEFVFRQENTHATKWLPALHNDYAKEFEAVAWEKSFSEIMLYSYPTANGIDIIANYLELGNGINSNNFVTTQWGWREDDLRFSLRVTKL